MQVEFGLPERESQELVDYLNKALANNYGLYFITLSCHWNMEDPRFLFLHEMLQKQYEALAESGDLLAERVRQMGAKVPGSLSIFAKNSKFQDIDVNASGNDMIAHLAKCHEMVIADFRELSEVAENHKDYGLVDLLGSLLRDHEKIAWILRSHL